VLADALGGDRGPGQADVRHADRRLERSNREAELREPERDHEVWAQVDA
jgi:hypothetical protein